MKNVIVSLTPDELYAACAVACHRRIVSMFNRSKPQHYQCPDNTEWSTEIEAAAAEIAVARFMNRYWSGSEWNKEVAKADVGTNIQVRYTHHANGHLIIYKEDADDQWYVLVTGRAPDYRLVGMIWGKDGKQQNWFDKEARYPAYFVAQSNLKDLPQIQT